MIARSFVLGAMRLRAPAAFRHTPRPAIEITRRYATTSSNPPRLPKRASKARSAADDKVDEVTELYATAQDEFEIAMEETEKVSVYAEADRKAAWEEFAKMKETFQQITEGEDKEIAEEVQRRIGHRIRELEQGLMRMDEMANAQD